MGLSAFLLINLRNHRIKGQIANLRRAKTGGPPGGNNYGKYQARFTRPWHVFAMDYGKYSFLHEIYRYTHCT